MGMNDYEEAEMTPKMSRYFESYKEDIASDNLIYYLTGEITREKAVDFHKSVFAWESILAELGQKLPIQILIDSDGGDLMATFSILNAIAMTEVPIFTNVIGTAASGAFLIAIAGQKRACGPYSEYVLHKGGIDVVGLNADEFFQQSNHYQEQLKMIKDLVLARTHITSEEYDFHCNNGDWFFTAQEAKRYGLSDNIYLGGK